MSRFDLEAYLERIGYTGDRTPSLATLQAVHALHAQTIPFENLDPLLRRPVRLDVESLQQKLVHGGRGGWCFEQNLLLRHALEAMGFKVTGLAARVLANRPPGAVPPRTHMLLRVDLDDGPYLADVGFGGMTLTSPIRLESDIEQPTTHEPRRLLRQDHEYLLQAWVRGEWTTSYRFDLQQQLLPDYEMANWYLSNHPESHFLHRLMVARATPRGRYALRDNEFAIHHLNGETERRELTSAAELRATLESVFEIDLPDDPELDAVLERFTQKPR